MTDSCETCFYLRTDADGDPICAFWPPDKLNTGTGIRAVWPKVNLDQWCGHFSLSGINITQPFNALIYATVSPGTAFSGTTDTVSTGAIGLAGQHWINTTAPETLWRKEDDATWTKIGSA